jgi:hypothetical protein
VYRIAGQVPGEALHGDSAPREYPDCMGDVRPGFGQDTDVIACPIRPGTGCHNNGVAEDDVWSEEANVAQPFNWCCPVPAGDFQEFVDRL